MDDYLMEGEDTGNADGRLIADLSDHFGIMIFSFLEEHMMKTLSICSCHCQHHYALMSKAVDWSERY